jgi:BMFP domain-containing protein YqiC
MQTQNPFLDDLAKVAAGAVGGLAGIKHEVETRLREQSSASSAAWTW